MGDAGICEELRQIFPQVEPTVIEQMVAEKKSNGGVDIFAECIEDVLARQEEEKNGQRENDDVILVKSVRRETSMKGQTRSIPLLFVDEDISSHSSRCDFGTMPSLPRPFSDFYDPKSSNYESNGNHPMKFPVIQSLQMVDSAPMATQSLQMSVLTPLKKQGTRVRNPDFETHSHDMPFATPVHKPPLTHTVQTPGTSGVRKPATPVGQTTTLSMGTPFEAPTPLLSEKLDEDMVLIRQMYPRVNEEFVKSLSQQGYGLNDIVNRIIDRPDVQNSGSCENQSCSKETASTKEINYITDTSEPTPYSNLECETLLRNKFRRVSAKDIKEAMLLCNGHFAAAFKLIAEALIDMDKKSKSLQENTSLLDSILPQNSFLKTTSSSEQKKKFYIDKLLASNRNRRRIAEPHPQLRLEIEFLEKQVMLNEERKNAIYAAHINKQQYMDEGELIECGCCFGEFPFEEIVQCSDGHLFCKECLHGYAKEIIFGSAMTSVSLVCMGDDCNQPFPYNQLEKCLTEDEIDKYQKRLQQDCLSKVSLDNLHQCPHCEFAAIIPDDQKVFACMNPKCMKESCVECKEDWKEHFGKKCNEIEKKSQTSLRLSYEERMTMAKVRKCAKCSLTFTKSDGCNKMTCRCGTTQCYVCRKSGIDYGHFCRHPRDPGKNCAKCAACSLWTDPTEDDELAIKQLQDEAAVAKRKLTEELEQSSKKQKV